MIIGGTVEKRINEINKKKSNREILRKEDEKYIYRINFLKQ